MVRPPNPRGRLRWGPAGALTVLRAAADDPLHAHRAPVHVFVVALSRQEAGEGERRPKGREREQLPPGLLGGDSRCGPLEKERVPGAALLKTGLVWAAARLRFMLRAGEGWRPGPRVFPPSTAQGV